MKPGISHWLRTPSLPANLYELLGHPLLDPDREAMLQSLRTANRELLDYQSHDDSAIAKRAMALITELGRARGILEDRSKHQAYDEELIAGIRREFAQARVGGDSDLAAWLRVRHGLDHFFSDHIAARVKGNGSGSAPALPALAERPKPVFNPAPVMAVPAWNPAAFETSPAPAKAIPAKPPPREPVYNLEDTAEPVVLLSAAPPRDATSKKKDWWFPALLAMAALFLISVAVLGAVAVKWSGRAEAARIRSEQLEGENERLQRETAVWKDRVLALQTESADSASKSQVEIDRIRTQMKSREQEIAKEKDDEIGRLKTRLAGLDAVHRIEVENLGKKAADVQKELTNRDETLSRYLRAVDWREKSNDDNAILELDEAIRLNPRFAEAFLLRGHAWFNKKEFDKAFDDYSSAIRIDPRSAKAYNSRGIVHHRDREYDRAIADYSSSIALDPKLAHVLTNRGSAWSRKSEYEKALADFNEAIRINPKYAFAFQCRAQLWTIRKEYDKAIRDFKQAILLDPKDDGAYYNMACSYSLQMRTDLALESFQRALELGYRNFTHIETDSDLDTLRSDPRFKMLIEKYKK